MRKESSAASTDTTTAAILSADGMQVLLSAGQAAGAPAAQVSGLQVPEIPSSGETVSFREGGAICAAVSYTHLRGGDNALAVIETAQKEDRTQPVFFPDQGAQRVSLSVRQNRVEQHHLVLHEVCLLYTS